MIHRISQLLPAFALGLWAVASFAHAQSSNMNIIAVVNDEIITQHDLETELNFVLLTSQLPDTPQTRQRLRGNILRQLIDQRLQLRAIKEAGLALSEAGLQQQVTRLENNNGMRPGDMARLLSERNSSITNLHNKLTAELVWRELITERFHREQFVGEDEIDERIAFLITQRAKPKHRIAEIFLPIKDIASRGQTEALGGQLMQNLENGAKFSALARSFSQSPSAQSGGDLGWISADTLQQPLDEIVANSNAGEVIGPIPVPGGFTLLLVVAIQPPQNENDFVTLDLVRAIKRDISDDKWQEMGQNLGQNCEATTNDAQIAGLSFIADAPISDFSEQIFKILSDLPENATSDEIAIGTNQIYFHLCARKITQPPAPDREQIRAQLEGERINNLGRRSLNDLQNDAFIDIRVARNS